jgi:ferredoxin
MTTEGFLIMAYQITERCTNCEDCLAVCPLEAISDGKDRPIIDPDLCTDCGTCSDICPARAIEGGQSKFG